MTNAAGGVGLKTRLAKASPAANRPLVDWQQHEDFKLRLALSKRGGFTANDFLLFVAFAALILSLAIIPFLIRK